MSRPEVHRRLLLSWLLDHGDSRPQGQLGTRTARHRDSQPQRQLDTGTTDHEDSRAWGQPTMGTARHSDSWSWGQSATGTASHGDSHTVQAKERAHSQSELPSLLPLHMHSPGWGR